VDQRLGRCERLLGVHAPHLACVDSLPPSSSLSIPSEFL
jgi:hypothetical protein